MIHEVEDRIFSIEVPLPENPLKELNSYFIRGRKGERSLLIDTGFNRPECWEALESGLRTLNVELKETDVFLTHLHSDHTGSAPRLQRQGCRVFMGQVDNRLRKINTWRQQMERAVTEGFDRSELDRVFIHNPAVIYSPEEFEAQDLQEGDCIAYGDRELRCIQTPGHTLGHMCLYDEKGRLMFLGDHVLFDITPNIIAWHEGRNPLKLYIESLEKIKGLDVEVPLPAHRTTGDWTMSWRAEFLIEHHDKRLKEVLNILDREPGLDAYGLAGRMKWSIRTKNWDTFPPGQKWFAVGEALAHLEFLMAEKMVERREDPETRHRSYYLSR